MATRYPLSALAFPCVTMLWLSSQISVSFTTAAENKHMAILGNVNCTLSSSCMPDRKHTDKFYRLVVIAETIMEVTRPKNSNRLRNINNNTFSSRRDRNVLYPETPINTTNSSIMLFRMDKQVFTGEEVTSAVLKIYIKTKGKRRRRRIVLHVSENTEEGKLSEFATIKLRVKRKGWQKINLPVYLLNKLQYQPIKLHVSCEKCNKKVRVVLPLKKSKKSKSKKFRDLASRKRRSPIIVLNTKPNSAAAAAAAAAVAASIATRHLRRSRRDIFQTRGQFRENVIPIGEPAAPATQRGSLLAQKLWSNKKSFDGIHKSPFLTQGTGRGSKNSDEPTGGRTVLGTQENRLTYTKSNYDDGMKDYNINGLEDDDDDDDDDDDNYDGDYDEVEDDDDDDDDDDQVEYADYDDEDEDAVENERNVMDSETENVMHESEKEHSFRSIENQKKDEAAVANKGCCIKSRFVSFESIGLSGLVVRPKLGFVSNQCSDFCALDLSHVIPLAREDFKDSADGADHHMQNPPAVQYRDRPEKFTEENRKRSLLDKLTINHNLNFRLGKKTQPSFFQPIKQRHRFYDGNRGIHPVQHEERNLISADKLKINNNYKSRNKNKKNNNISNNNNNNNHNDIYHKNPKHNKKRNVIENKNKKRNSYKKNRGLRSGGSCRPVEYKNLNLSFITADLKVEKMTLPDAIVSKCGYV